VKRRLDRHLVALVALLALALALRVWRLDAQSLWNDEGTSVALAQRDIATILRNAADDIHPPLYYILLHFWVRLVGSSEAAVRGLSALCGVGVVGATYLLARRVLSDQGALLASLFAACSPFQVYYSQEARMYMPATLLGLLLVLACDTLFTRWHWRASLRSPIALAILLTSSALLHTHYYGATLLVAVNLAFLIWMGVEWRVRGRFPLDALWRWGILMLVGLATFVPWLMAAWHTLIYWPAISQPTSLTELLRQLIVVLPLGITVPIDAYTLAIGAVAIAMAALGLAALVVQPHDRGVNPNWRPWLLACYLAAPVAIMYLGSLRRPMINFKFILLVTPALHVLMAAGISVVAGRVLRAGARRRGGTVFALALPVVIVIAGMATSLHGLYYDPRYARDDYRGIVAYIHENAGPHAAILINAPSQIETIDYYHDEPPPMYPLARQRPMDVAQTVAELEMIVSQHDELYGIFWATTDSDPDGVIENWLAEHTFKSMDRWYGNLRLVIYAAPAHQPMKRTAVDARFGEDIRLLAHSMPSVALKPGGTVTLTLEWEALRPIGARYTVFAQLLDSQHRIVGQHDSEPAGGRQPTVSWVPGQVVQDNRGILIERGTPAGEYALVVGLYDQTTGQRLSLTLEGQPAGDALSLPAIQIAE